MTKEKHFRLIEQSIPASLAGEMRRKINGDFDRHLDGQFWAVK
jgi:hypothetical protein